MTKHSKMAKKSLSALLALVMLLSCFSGITLTASAAGYSKTVGELMAENYDLTAQEEELLESGLLAGTDVKVEYDLPADCVSIDTDSKTITASVNNGFKPIEAVLKAVGVNEPITLDANGIGTYSYDGNAFSVEVTYVLTHEVDTAVQEKAVASMGWIKQGIANTDAVAAQSGNLYILEQAMPQLVNLANTGVETSFTTVELSAECKAAIAALNTQMSGNGGQLLLSTMVEEYETGSKTGYLLNNGAEMKAAAEDLNSKAATISVSLNTIYENIEWLISGGFVSEALANQIKTLANVCNDLVAGLATVVADPWDAVANGGTALVKNSPDYAALDVLIAALGGLTVVSTKGELKVDEHVVSANAAMYNITVNVILNTVQDNEVREYAKKTVVLEPLTENSEYDVIMAAITASGAENNALTEWNGVYVEGKFDRTTSSLPATLTEDIEYTITYNPKEYTVTIAGEPAEYPYGYQLTLPVHENPAKSYDYRCGGTYYAQGAVVTVEDNMTFTREEGKAYTTKNLLSIIAENYGTPKIATILKSGALNVDETINYREPNQAELEGLVALDGNTLTVQTYASSYAGLDWEPYSYVVDSEEPVEFGGVYEVDLGAEFTTVSVYYRLTFSNYSEADVKEILDLVAELVDEAAGQKSVMDRLAGYGDQMSQLNKNMLNGLNGMIGGYAVSGGGTFSDELVADTKAIINDIIASCCAPDGSLKLNGIINGYTDPNNGGLIYYYQNEDYINEQIGYLSDKLEALLGDPQGKDLLATLLTDMSYGDYVEKLDDLNTKMAAIKADLAPVNAAISTLDAAKLQVLANALTMAGSVAYGECGSPYVEMGPIIRTATRFVTVEVKVDVNGNTNTTPIAVTIERNTALNQTQVSELKAKVAAFVATYVGDEYFYNNDYNSGAELDALVGVALVEGATYRYTWTPKEFTVKIAGEADQIITIENLTVNLPAHPDAANGMSYEYTIAGNPANAGIFTFTADQVKTLFVDGVYTITRIEKNAKIEALKNMKATINSAMGHEVLTLIGENDEYTGVEVNIAADELMDFVQNLALSGYGYIGLNNEGFVYSTTEDGLQISIQTLINAILNDETFSNETIMALANNGNGKLLTASLQLGNDADDIAYEDLAFTINLTSVPGMITEKADMLESVFNIVNFNANDGVLDISVTLPDQVYGAYLALLVATGELDKTDVNSLENEEAINFLVDYLNKVLAIESLGSVQNTIDMLGADFDVSGYQGAYNFVKQNVKIGYGGGITVFSEGKDTIEGLLSMLQIDAAEMETYLGMIKEYGEESIIQINAKITEVTNADVDYNALVVDVDAAGMKDKFAVTSTAADLNNKLDGITDMAAVILLDDVTGNLEIAGKTILDLNGKTITGDVNGTGSLYIIDSNMGTMNCGGIDGDVDGTVTVVAGKYTDDVTEFLKDGYVQEDGFVSNALYTIEEDAEGNITFVINSDVFEDESVEGYTPDTEALAIDIAGDLILNYFTAAALTIDENTLYAMNFNDVIGMLDGTGKLESAVDAVLGSVDMAGGVTDFVNAIIADVLDFAAVKTAIEGDGVIATYAATSSPWMIDFVEVDDYATVQLTANTANAKNFNISIKVEGDSAKTYVAPLLGELNRVVTAKDVEVKLTQPTFAGATLSNIGANVNANIAVDLTIDYSNDGGFTQDDYIAMTAVILAYGNADKRAAIATALNEDDMFALKEIVDAMTVKDVFDSFKALSRNVSFASMADAVGADDVANAAELEELYHLYFCGIGKALVEAKIEGYADRTMGDLFDDETDAYVFEKENVDYSGSASAGNYIAEYEVMAESVTVSVKLFGEVTPIPKYTVTVENGTITEVNGEPWDGTTVEFKAGTEITVKADDPDDGDRFAGWDVTGVTLTDDTQEITFAMPSNAVTLTATYEEIPAEQGWTAAPVVEEEWVYDGEPHITVPTANYGDVETIYEIEENGVYTSYTGTPVNVGKYRVTFRVPAGTYDGVACEELTATFDFEITPRPISIADVITVGREYDGTNVVEISEVIFNNVVAGDDVGYTVESAVMADVNAGIGKNVTVNVTISNTNYSLAVATVNATVDIAKVQRDNQTGEQSVKYGNSITIDSVYDVDNEVAIIYGIEDESGILDGTPLVENGKLSVTIKNNASLDGKSVKIVVLVSGNLNYTDYFVEYTINVTSKAPQTITAADVTVTYGETGKRVEATNETTGGGAITYRVKSGNDVVDVDPTTGALTIKKAGTAVITVTAAETDTYAAATKDVTVTVNPKPVSAPTADDSVFTYNGNEQTYAIAENADYTITGNKQTNAGTYTVTVALKDKNNTAWATGGNADKTFNFVIGKASVAVTAIDQSIKVDDTVPNLSAPVAGTHYTVTGLVGSDELTTITMEYQLDGSAVTPDNTKTGTYDIVITTVDAGANYTVTTTDATLTISRRSTGGGGSSNNTYSIVVLSAENGTVTANKTKATKNETVTLMAKADQGYMLESLTVTTSSGSNVALTERGGGKYTFSMPASKVTVKATFVKRAAGTTSFLDISTDDYFYDAVLWAVEMGITDGTSETTFSPELGCTRAQMVTFLWRASGMPEATITETPFVDVDEYSYYYEALLWAYEVGVTDGTSETTFSPDEICTRGQMAAFMYRHDDKPAVSGDHPFEDVAVNDYYHNAVIWAFGEGITDGTSDNTFSPKNVCTRGQMVTFLYRFLAE